MRVRAMRSRHAEKLGAGRLMRQSVAARRKASRAGPDATTKQAGRAAALRPLLAPADREVFQTRAADERRVIQIAAVEHERVLERASEGAEVGTAKLLPLRDD